MSELEPGLLSDKEYAALSPLERPWISEGARARSEGKGFGANPHDVGTAASARWIQGYLARGKQLREAQDKAMKLGGDTDATEA